MLIGTGGIGSSDKGPAIFPQNVAAVLINPAGTEAQQKVEMGKVLRPWPVFTFMIFYFMQEMQA
jgi:hypothetical protein